MDTANLAGLIISVGSLIPLLIAVVQQPSWSNRTRTIMAVAVSAIAGTVTYVTQFGLDFSNPGAIVTVVVGVVMASVTSYKSIWKPVGLAGTIETATSQTPVTAEPEHAVDEAYESSDLV